MATASYTTFRDIIFETGGMKGATNPLPHQCCCLHNVVYVGHSSGE